MGFSFKVCRINFSYQKYMKKINIIVVNRGFGLNKSVSIIAQVLRNANFQVSVFEVGKPTIEHKIQRITTYLEKFVSNTLLRKPTYDINIFLEDVIPSWFSFAKINCLIPHQEWFRDEARQYLPQFDYILCLTKFAQSIFDNLGCKTEFISFTTFDRFDEQYSKNYNQFFHLAGSNSKQKGTKTIIDTWLRHPEWPTLTLRQNKKDFHIPAPNIKYITEFLNDPALLEYQNTYAIHLCPSEAEGFGHYIVEAMSCQAVTVTTNAPPMNELITPERGILVDYSHTKPQRLGINYYVDSQSLEQKIDRVLGMDFAQKKQLGENARVWYIENDRFFRHRLVEIISNL